MDLRLAHYSQCIRYVRGLQEVCEIGPDCFGFDWSDKE